MSKYYLPGVGGQVDNSDEESPFQMNPLMNSYSPRLFGSPPQLTHLNDMRLKSSDGTSPGPVGDFYLTNIIQDANIANFVIGKALFTGGMNSLAGIIKVAGQYAVAMHRYDILDGSSGESVYNKGTAEAMINEYNLSAYQSALGDEGDFKTVTASAAGLEGVDGNMSVLDMNSVSGAKDVISSLGQLLTKGGAYLSSAILTSLSVQQPFYTFESDWYSYINNVKMMINTAVIMLGLQKACVRIGDYFYPIGMTANVTADNDVWSNYRFITAKDGLGDVTAIDTMSGDTAQYVSFMIDPTGTTEIYSNTIEDSQLYSSVINSGSSIGSEIAFISNSSVSTVNDVAINLATKSVNAAEKVLTSLSSGVGRFTAAIAGSMARSYVGDHTIYPKVFQGHSATSGLTVTTHLRASSGDPYTYLTEVLVPLFFIYGMALPELSKNNASAYAYPPIIQCNIPGMWGTRLGMIEQITVNKNVGGTDVSIHGFPLAIDVTIEICDLQHTLVTSGMNKISTFLNNHTMFDYIAQCASVDKYRVNGSMRLVAKLTLAASAIENILPTLGDAFMSDFTSFANRLSGVGMI